MKTRLLRPVRAPARPLARRQRGAALIISLMLLAVVMLLSTAGWQVATQEERMAGMQRDRAIAFEAAEAALRDGERDLLGVCAVGVAAGQCATRVDPINGETGFGNGGTPGTCSALGLCLGVVTDRPDFSSNYVTDVLRSAPAAIGAAVLYGTYTRPATDRNFNGPAGAPLPWQPRYVIESLCYGGGGQGMTGSYVASCPSPIYRITAIARGVRESDATSNDQSSQVMLQSFYSLGN